MSILIKGMEMPKSCPLCELYRNGNKIENTSCYCAILNTAVDPFKRERPSDCPLIEVPKHGRLIDADSVEKQIDYVANLDWNRKVGASGGMFAALEIVEDALTIIESEEE